jgi:hypothetical protein
MSMPAALAEDAVDRAKTSYDQKLQQGLLKINTDHINELKAIKTSAIKASDLATAKKADDRIKRLEEENKKLAPSPLGSYPQNAHYKMVWSNRKQTSEHGKEIVCRF